MANDSLKKDFDQAAKDVMNLSSKPGNDDLLALYALFKQATDGDVQGSRPGMLDIKGRAKFDAWTKRKGLSKDQAMSEYVATVRKLQGR